MRFPSAKLLPCIAFALAAGLPSAAATKTVVCAVAATYTSLDPYDTNATLDQAVCKSFYQGLFGFDKNLRLQNVLADSYEASKDGLTYTVKLKKHVKFHDGTDFNAAAVKANFDRVTNPENKLKRYSLFSNIAKTEVVNDATVRFTLKVPFSAFINQLAHPSAAIISPAALAKYGKEIGLHPVGTGPFRFVEWRQPDYMKVEKSPNYWKKGYPRVDAIVWKSVTDNNTRTAMIQAGEASYTPVPFEQAENLKQNPKLDVISSPGIVTWYMSMNTAKKPFSDLRVRQALNYAINKEAMIKAIYYGYAEIAKGPVPGAVQYSANIGTYPFDLAKARKLLAEAGYPNGFETELWGGNNSTAAKAMTFLQQQLSQVGVKARITAQEPGQRVELLENVQKPEEAGVRLNWAGWSASTGEADWALRPLFATSSIPPKGLQNFAYYSNPKLDALLQKALATTKAGEKTRIYKEAQEIIFKDAPWVFLVNTQQVYVRTKNLAGIYLMPDGSMNFDDIELK